MGGAGRTWCGLLFVPSGDGTALAQDDHQKTESTRAESGCTAASSADSRGDTHLFRRREFSSLIPNLCSRFAKRGARVSFFTKFSLSRNLMNICQLGLREPFRLLTLLLHLRADLGERRSGPFLLVKTPRLTGRKYTSLATDILRHELF